MVKKMIIHLECQVALSSGFSFRFLFFATIMSSLRDCLSLFPAGDAVHRSESVGRRRTVNHQRIYFSLLPKTVRRLMAPGL
jgi:hypothetical protein